MFTSSIDPVLLRLGPLEVRYYGMFWALGFVIAYFMLIKLSKEKGLKLSKDDISDYLLHILIGAILGARVFYILIYNLPFYAANPLDIFAVWHGGLSFHGGLVGAVIGGIIFTKRKRLHFYDMADITVIPLALGLALGRLGNFANGELYGRITNVPWAVKFRGAEGFRHPSQIYASLKNLLSFTVLWNIRKLKLPRGFLFWAFVALYGFLRFIVEFYRAPDAQLGFYFGWLTMGQILSGMMFFIGSYNLYGIYNKAE
ncbi:prolipoprotein diacylglyceryl transferase [Candidatus Woesearchaeota archaeon]|nr:prolipoprotein diacylglyceryl transferase [Candidatus Woesearchaeota archaeon]